MCNRLTKTSLNTPDAKQVRKLENKYHIEVLEVVKDRKVGEVRPTLINGEPVERSDWPEVVRINRSCTATLVGSNCAITAAHCGDNGERGFLELFDGTDVTFTVIQMPQYIDAGASFDLSVLKLDDDVNVPFASVGLNHSFRNGQQVVLAGYGCTRPDGTGGNDDILRIGPSKVVGESGTDIVSQWREQDGAALCFGDSGGPMFHSTSKAGSRTLIAVNSKGNIRDTNYNMRLDIDEVREFLELSADRHGLEIYGVNARHEDGDGDSVAKNALRELKRELSDVAIKVKQLEEALE